MDTPKNERVVNAIARDNQRRTQQAIERLNKATKHQRPAYMKRQGMGGDINAKVIAAQKPVARQAPAPKATQSAAQSAPRAGRGIRP